MTASTRANRIATGLLLLVTLSAASLLAQEHADPRQTEDRQPERESPLDDAARATHRFEDADKWAEIWDNPARDAWQQPERVVELMQIERGMTVVDIGAGTGHFNSHLSDAVGANGIVYAVDVEPNLVDYMKERADRENTINVRPILAAYDDPHIPPGRVDRVLLVDTFHHIDGRIAYFGRLAQRLDASSLLVNVDWKPGDLPLGPSTRHKIAPEEVVAELAEAGYDLVEQHELTYQYVQIFRLRRPAQP